MVILVLWTDSEDQNQTVCRSCLIRVYTVCYSICIFRKHYLMGQYKLSICKASSSNIKVLCHLSLVVRKPVFAYAKTKTQISFAVTAKLISAFVFATQIVQSLYYLNPKFQASSHHLWLYSPVCVGPGRKPRRPVFSERGSFLI